MGLDFRFFSPRFALWVSGFFGIYSGTNSLWVELKSSRFHASPMSRNVRHFLELNSIQTDSEKSGGPNRKGRREKLKIQTCCANPDLFGTIVFLFSFDLLHVDCTGSTAKHLHLCLGAGFCYSLYALPDPALLKSQMPRRREFAYCAAFATAALSMAPSTFTASRMQGGGGVGEKSAVDGDGDDITKEGTRDEATTLDDDALDSGEDTKKKYAGSGRAETSFGEVQGRINAAEKFGSSQDEPMENGSVGGEEVEKKEVECMRPSLERS
ncbi:hypothetical protein R3P38DRAFT_3351433 [Favolaschia claudopus]|uniref:Uncharacterized protein n=1 Tax=Favolaschia claudopus TaxID=2862362 RepID=A0AAW0C6G1_9AGAR